MAKSLQQKVRDATQKAVRQTAVELMNDLAEAGPEWSGKLKNSWVADAPSFSKLGRTTGYPYSLNSVPALPTTIKATEATPVKIVIRNKVAYFPYAADLLPGKFWPKTDGPKGSATTGSRNTTNGAGYRGDVGGSGTNISTAPLDWYPNYLRGGGMKRAIQNAIRFGFRASA